MWINLLIRLGGVNEFNSVWIGRLYPSGPCYAFQYFEIVLSDNCDAYLSRCRDDWV